MSNLAKCRDCGTEVSTSAEACPKCGATNPANQKRKHRTELWIGGGVVALILVGMIFGGDSSTGSTPKPQSTQLVPIAVCNAMRSTGSNVKCTVIGVTRTIKVTMDTYDRDAQKICRGAVNEISQRSNALSGWRMQIFATSRDDRAAATCHF